MKQARHAPVRAGFTMECSEGPEERGSYGCESEPRTRRLFPIRLTAIPRSPSFPPPRPALNRHIQSLPLPNSQMLHCLEFSRRR